MRNISLTEHKKLQLDILKNIHRYCVEKGLNYTLAYGTLIGALRHNGFIPWDDDIDIAMPREDYEKFLREYKHDIYKVHCLENDSNYLNAVAKVEDTRTLIEEDGSTENLGVFVDVFPLDSLFDDAGQCENLFKKITFYRRLLAFRLLTSRYFQEWWKRWVFIVGKRFLCFIPKRWIVEKIDSLAKSGQSEARYWGMFAGGLKFALIDHEDLQHYISHRFEDTDFLILRDYDRWLSQIYGDYMVLPPVEKRKTVHFFNKVYWKE